ncbi:hypothetical protein HK098_004066 [Nowakowskiella sp. JEL0407]|nr:hypothetical protein HK098_004066 [Nowakowskiella sp. JEL0407]
MCDYSPADGKRLNAVRRVKERAHYDSDIINDILDDGLICHVGFSAPAFLPQQETAEQSPDSDLPTDYPFVIPMAYGRLDSTIYLHGYVSGRLVKQLSSPTNLPKVCITVTHIDGLVFALSAFHHSMEYRSAMIFGTGRLVTDLSEKDTALKVITNHTTKKYGDRWADLRPATAVELKTTSVIAVDILTASAKVRNHGVKDDLEDLKSEELMQNTWSGVVSVNRVFGDPVSTDYNQAQVPDYVKNLANSKSI